MPRGGLANTLLPPNMANLAVWADYGDLDGQRNKSLTVNAAVPTGLKNKGYLGGTWTLPSGTGPTLRQNAAGLYSLDHGGADRRLLISGLAALAQPNVVGMVVRRNSVSTQGLCDGVAGARHCFFDNGGTQLNMGTSSFIGAAVPTTTSQYNIVWGNFNGATGQLDLNRNLPIIGSYVATGAVGAQAPTGFTIGALNDGSSPLNGETACGFFVWHGTAGSTAPTSQQFWDYVARRLQHAWPTTTLAQHTGYLIPPIQFQVHGGDLVTFIGNSITAGTPNIWFTPYVASCNAGLITPITTANKGIASQTTTQMLARFNADVIVPGSQCCVLEGSTNDFGLTPPVPLDTTISNVQAMINLWTGAAKPANKMLIMGMMCRGEQFPDPYEVEQAQLRDALSFVARQNGCAFADVRSAQQAYEFANNTPQPGNVQSPGPGAQILLTIDQSHPTTPQGTGVWSNAAFAVTTLTG